MASSRVVFPYLPRKKELKLSPASKLSTSSSITLRSTPPTTPAAAAPTRRTKPPRPSLSPISLNSSPIQSHSKTPSPSAAPFPGSISPLLASFMLDSGDFEVEERASTPVLSDSDEGEEEFAMWTQLWGALNKKEDTRVEDGPQREEYVNEDGDEDMDEEDQLEKEDEPIPPRYSISPKKCSGRVKPASPPLHDTRGKEIRVTGAGLSRRAAAEAESEGDKDQEGEEEEEGAPMNEAAVDADGGADEGETTPKRQFHSSVYALSPKKASQSAVAPSQDKVHAELSRSVSKKRARSEDLCQEEVGEGEVEARPLPALVLGSVRKRCAESGEDGEERSRKWAKVVKNGETQPPRPRASPHTPQHCPLPIENGAPPASKSNPTTLTTSASTCVKVKPRASTSTSTTAPSQQDTSQKHPSDKEKTQKSKTKTPMSVLYKKNTAHWALDGSMVVLLAGERYKIHRSRIVRGSAWFAEVLKTYSTSSSSAHPTTIQRRNTPRVWEEDEEVVVSLDGMGVRKRDWEALLEGMDSAVEWVHEQPPLKRVLGILRVAVRLRVSLFEGWGRRVLQEAFPDALDHMFSGEAGGYGGKAGGGCEGKGGGVEMAEVVSVARMCGLAGVVKRALWEVCTDESFGMSSGSEDDSDSDIDVEAGPEGGRREKEWTGRLDVKDVARMLVARSRIQIKWVSMTGVLPDIARCGEPSSSSATGTVSGVANMNADMLGGNVNVGASGLEDGVGAGWVRCVSHDVAAAREAHHRLVIRSGVQERWMVDPVRGFEVLAGLRWGRKEQERREKGEEDEDMYGGFCEGCVEQMRRVWMRTRERIWKDFGEVIAVAGEEDLSALEMRGTKGESGGI
ncbi:hypothetical protein DFP72DRAFT_856874 [Ephemerocybe angulata]|uniref:BTB domain-containing protein n=1 Tax=Ephemerocybe angulata TaxID=980116 RepID=A0A8H6HDE4_9AGAR|nr:hypothetical protein DFP72DRAFT_856874 [Tulosesus angulatus]